MRTAFIFRMVLVCCAAVSAALSQSAAAQGPSVSAVGSKPPQARALNERARRFAALPDWSGIWETRLSAAMSSGEIDKLIARAAQNPNRPEFNFARPGILQPFEVEFFRLVQLLQKPPYNPEWEGHYHSQVASLNEPRAPMANDAAVKACTWGFPLLMESPTDGVFQLFVTPEETLFLFANGEVRHIYTDGRPHPNKEDLWPTPMGNSIGRWEGHTLVVETIARTAGPLIADSRFVSPDFSDQARFTERLRKLGRDAMQDDLTIEDPARLAHPWHLTLHYRRVTNMDRLIATNCTDNDRNPVVNGQLTIAPR